MLSGAAVQRLPASQGMVSAFVCVCSSVDECDRCATLTEKVRFKGKTPKKDQFSLKSILVVSRQFDSHKSLLSYEYFLLNRSRYCIWKIWFGHAMSMATNTLT